MCSCNSVFLCYSRLKMLINVALFEISQYKKKGTKINGCRLKVLILHKNKFK